MLQLIKPKKKLKSIQGYDKKFTKISTLQIKQQQMLESNQRQRIQRCGRKRATTSIDQAANKNRNELTCAQDVSEYNLQNRLA